MLPALTEGESRLTYHELFWHRKRTVPAGLWPVGSAEQWEAELLVKTQWDWPGVRNRKLSVWGRGVVDVLGDSLGACAPGEGLGLHVWEARASLKARHMERQGRPDVSRISTWNQVPCFSPKLLPQPQCRPFLRNSSFRVTGAEHSALPLKWVDTRGLGILMRP